MDTDAIDRTETRPALRRSPHRMLAGVAAGASEYFDLDVTVVRIAFVALAFLGGAGIPVYLAAWLLIPEQGTEVSIAEDFLGHGHHHDAPHGVDHAHG
jgi:phage shock protein PspC (stress-responsive transcriptional regulator)